jgi:hypothetical protein
MNNPRGSFVQFCGFKSLKDISKRFQNGQSVKKHPKRNAGPNMDKN